MNVFHLVSVILCLPHILLCSLWDNLIFSSVVIFLAAVVAGYFAGTYI